MLCTIPWLHGLELWRMSLVVECCGLSVQFDSHSQGRSLALDRSNGTVDQFHPSRCRSSSRALSRATWIHLEIVPSLSLQRRIHQRVDSVLHLNSIAQDNARDWRRVHSDNKAGRCAFGAVLISKQRCLYRPWPLPWTLLHNAFFEWIQHDRQFFSLLVPFAACWWSSQLHLSTNNSASRATHYRFRWFLWSQNAAKYSWNHFSTRASSAGDKTSSNNAHDLHARNFSPWAIHTRIPTCVARYHST